MAIVMDPGIITRYVWITPFIQALGIHTQQGAVIAAGVPTDGTIAIVVKAACSAGSAAA